MKGIARTLSSIVVESMPVQLLSHLLTQHQYTADCQSIYFEGRKKVKDSEEIVTHSCPTLFNPMDCSPPDSLSMGFSRQEYWSGCHAFLQGIFLSQRSNPSPALVGWFFTTSTTWEALEIYFIYGI